MATNRNLYAAVRPRRRLESVDDLLEFRVHSLSRPTSRARTSARFVTDAREKGVQAERKAVRRYRATDRDGNLIDTMLSPTRDMKAARRFFRSARSVAGFVPDRVTNRRT